MSLTEVPVVTTAAPVAPQWRPSTTEQTVVRLRGEHDISTVPALAAELAGAIAGTDAGVTLDLSEVEFMDASTVGVILGARRFLEPHQRALTLRSPAQCAQRIIDICDLRQLVEPPGGG